MVNKQSTQYGFCPKCGAVSKNGVCTVCKGARTKADTGVRKSVSASDNNKKKTISKPLIAILVIIMIGIVGVGNLSYFMLAYMQEDMLPMFETVGDEEIAVEDYGAVDFFGDEYYMGPEDAIRDDLAYLVDFSEEEYYMNEQNGIYCRYPILSGDIPNLEYINGFIYDEYLYYYEYCKENILFSEDEDDFFAVINGYVTYMDDNVLSIVFDENVTWGDYGMGYLSCINIDVSSGVIQKNTDIVKADVAFAEEFRLRDRTQNQSDILDYYTDEELTEMLNDEGSLIVYYTPLGLEVGLNHDYGWNTVTYNDSGNVINQF